MIGVNGQYVFIFSIADKRDFIEESDLIQFKLVEKAGNILPTFSLDFFTNNPEIPRYLHEGNVLNVSFGKSIKNDIDDTSLLIMSSNCSRHGVEKIRCTVTGILNKLTYHKTNVQITGKQDGLTTLKQITGKNFIFDSNIITTNTDNTMYWIQHGISDKKFINKVWLHTYIPNSFISVAISSDNRFIVRDIKKKFSSGSYDWKLTSSLDSPKDISYDGDYSIETKQGFINSWLGYKRVKKVYDVEDGLLLEFSHDTKPLIALTNKLIRNVEIESKNAEIGYISDNVHSNYWLAYLQNISNLAVASTVCLKTSFQNQFKRVKPLDSVMFKEISTDFKGAMEYSSGLYIVSNVTRILGNRQYLTCLEMCRESHNQPLGNLK